MAVLVDEDHAGADSASRGLLFAVILRHLIIGLRSLAATTSHQTIKRAKISASGTLSEIIRCLKRREFFRDRTDDELIQRLADFFLR